MDYSKPMGSINLDPNQDELSKLLKDLTTRLDNIERTRQQYLGDWIQLNTFELSYSANNVLNISRDPRDFLAIGDPVRIFQGGAYKYFYIIVITSTQITLTGGSDFTYTNAVFTEFSYSKIKNPTGHPILLNWNPSLSVLPGSSITIDPIASTANARFYINNTTCQIFMEFTFLTIGGAPTPIYGNLPVAKNINFLMFSPVIASNSGLTSAAIFKEGGTGTFEIYANDSFGDFSIGAFSADFFVNINYPI